MTQIDKVKPFKTYTDQLSILKQRGMRFPDEQKALAVLRSENYYRISAYWLTMLRKNQDGSEVFYPNASFDNVLDLYSFDSDLRKVISAATAIIETNLKSYVAYYHAKNYGPCGYMQFENAEDLWKHTAFMNSLAADINKRKDEAFVKHHDEDLGGIYPAWVATELCSFDQISKFYRNMLPRDRQGIAKEYYNISSREYIENWLHCAVVARNMAAHGARFYNKPTLKPAAKLPSHLQGHARSLFGYVYAIYNLLPLSDRTAFLDNICTCIENHSFVILRYLGFPEDWKTLIKNGSKQLPLGEYPSIVHADIERYLQYGWEWPVITKMVNRVHGHQYNYKQLESLYKQTATTLAPV